MSIRPCGIVLASYAFAAVPLAAMAAEVLRAPTTADGFLRDRQEDGVFEELHTTDHGLVIRDLSAETTLGPVEERAVIEFEVPEFSVGTVLQSVSFEFGASSWILDSTPILIEGFTGDGIVTREDAITAGVPLGSFLMTDLMAFGNTVVLDAEAFAGLIDASRLVTLRVRGPGEFVNMQIVSRELAALAPSRSPPTLAFTLVPEPRTAALLLPLLLAVRRRACRVEA